MLPQILHSTGEAIRFARGANALPKTIALVPTMGFLHEGHLTLMREAKQRADITVVSIFVNPTQFGPAEDLSRYPRDFDGDLSKCASVGIDAVFAPEVSELYPSGFQTFVEVAEVSRGLCGSKRPGHFRGVATIVAKLLALFRPTMALFGEKDYQQLQVIKTLSRDLNLGVTVIGVPTVREADGLAMSSRNGYLNPEDRQRALALYRGLLSAQGLVANGEQKADPICERVRAELRRSEVREDYVELVDAETLLPIQVISLRPARLLVAGFVGATRLIDNVPVGSS